MRRIVLAVSAATALVICGCGVSAVPVIHVPSDGETASLTLSFGSWGQGAGAHASAADTATGLSSDLSGQVARRRDGLQAGDWSGRLEISGEHIAGAYSANLYRDAVANGNVVLRLPVGLKIINMTLQYVRNDGQVDSYGGTATLVVAQSIDNNLSLTLSQVATGGRVTLDGQNERFINATFIEKNGGRMIEGANITFRLNGRPVKSVVVTEASQAIYLPVQGEQVHDIAAPYVYEIFHPKYQVLKGTLKVSMNEMEAEGVLIPNEEGYVNFQRFLDEDMQAPTINAVVYPNPAWDSRGDFSVLVNATDNRHLAAVSVAVNGNTATGSTVNGKDYSVAIPLEWLNHGENAVSITAEDASANITMVQRIISRSDDVRPYFRPPSNGSWTSNIALAGLPVNNLALDFEASDNFKIASVTGASLVSGNTYRLAIDANLPNGNYGTTVTATDTYDNSRTLTCNYAENTQAVIWGGWWWYRKIIDYSFAM